MLLKIIVAVLFWGGVALVAHADPVIGGWFLVIAVAYQLGTRVARLLARR